MTPRIVQLGDIQPWEPHESPVDVVAWIDQTDMSSETVIRSASSGRWFTVPELRRPAGWFVPGQHISLGVSPDGRRLLIGQRSEQVLGVRDLGTTSTRWHTLDTEGSNWLSAAAAADGMIAVVWGIDPMGQGYPRDCRCIVSLFDEQSGANVRIWDEQGGAGAGTVASWSPDGALLAVGYSNPADDFATVVIDRTGTVHHRMDGYLPGVFSNDAWAPGGARLLLNGQEYGAAFMAELHLVDGSIRPLPLDGSRFSPVGRSGPDLVSRIRLDATGPRGPGEPGWLYRVALDGSSEEAWFGLSDGAQVSRISFAAEGADRP